MSNSTRNRSIIGSPPHGRGKDSGTVHGCGQLRITPAWAGKSERLARCAAWAEGSPPRGRGKALPLYPAAPLYGITPAQAGKSNGGRPGKRASKDHSRTGGEKPAGRFLLRLDTGSPPRRRGKATRDKDTAAQHGITPAWAGKRRRVCPAGRAAQDHPRIGGEKDIPIMRAQRIWGSPPHRRGKVLFRRNAEQVTGITPAWAGKRRHTCGPCAAQEDHPRVGGEKPGRQERR